MPMLMTENALSSCEAEIMAASEAAKEAVFLDRLCGELGFKKSKVARTCGKGIHVDFQRRHVEKTFRQCKADHIFKGLIIVRFRSRT